MKLINDWRRTWRFFSVWSMTATGAIQAAWLAIPEGMKSALPEEWVNAGLYLRGRSTGRVEERQEREVAVAKQQIQARETVREVENEINQATDANLLDRAGKWVRREDSGRH